MIKYPAEKKNYVGGLKRLMFNQITLISRMCYQTILKCLSIDRSHKVNGAWSRF